MRLYVLLLAVAPLLTLAELRGPTGLPGSAAIAPWYLLGVLSLAAWSEWWGGERMSRGESARAWTIAGAIGAAAFAAMVPSPVREAALATALLLTATAIVSDARAPRIAVALGRIAALTIAILVATAVHWLAPMWLLLVRPEGALAHVTASFLGFLGVAANATDRGIALLADGGGRTEMGTGWVQLGIREAVALGTGLVTIAMLLESGRARARSLVTIAAALAGALAIRSGVGSILVLELREPGMMADPWVRATALAIPAAWVFVALQPAARAAEVAPIAHPPRRGAAPAAVASAASLVFAALLAGPSRETQMRIAIDEGHSTWARLDVPIGRYNFGTLSVYNYAEWVRGLERRHGLVRRLTQRLDDSSLGDVDVLILKTPTIPYTLDEVAAVHRFVERGGGLYTVGDHNDVFGMNSILEPIVAPYGIRYMPDAVNEIDYGGGGMVSRADVHPPHPLTRLMEPLHYMTSCTVAVSAPARPLMWTNHAYSDDSDYSKNNFIGDGTLTGSERFGPIAQVAVATPGRGKVLAFSDSTLFSNFSIHFPGVRELAFGGVAWLGRRDAWRGWRIPTAIVGTGVLAFAAWSLRRSPFRFAAAALAGLGGAWTIVEFDARRQLDTWRTQLDGRETVFDVAVSAGQLPIWHESHDELPDNFWGLFLAYQRTDRPMRVATRAQDTFGGRAAILVWPKRPLPGGFVDRARSFVAAGGTLYVFDDRVAAGSSANVVLEPFGLSFHAGQRGRHMRPGGPTGSEATVELGWSALVRGGEPIVFDERLEPLVARAKFGEGHVVAVGIAEDFSNARMSTSGTLRGPRGVQLLRLLYRAIDGDGEATDSALAAR